LYLQHVLVLNSGSIRDFELEMQFHDNGNPKPLILVGPNGTGKTNLLSLVADGLVEIAARVFSDVVSPWPGGGHQYFRLLSQLNARIGSRFELGALKFGEAEQHFHFESTFGKVDEDEVKARLSWWTEATDWLSEDGGKRAYGDNKQIEQVFREECHVFFPSNRWEKPHWSVDDFGNDETVFVDRLTGILRKPIRVATALSDVKPWLVDIFLDQMIDVGQLVGNSTEMRNQLLADTLKQGTALVNFNHLLQTILQTPQARLVRSGRTAGSRKLQVYDGDNLLLPSLESLSSGQSSLLAIFGTVLRYADRGTIASPMTEMKGIVLIDEIDAHLHANLQHDILPGLMARFPKIQFIVTSHSPLFPLGMEKIFGEDAIHMVEMPTGKRITAERFGEFLASFEMLKTTGAFEESIAEMVARQNRPLVLCEGETDPKYMRTAAELLGFDHLVTEVNWDWVGTVVDGVARDGGKDRLRHAKKLLRNNPLLLKTDTLLLFDCDTDEGPLDEGRLHVRVLPRNEANQRCDRGIENLLPESVFEDQFFKTETKTKGADETTTRTLHKSRLCDHLCGTTKNPQNFQVFREPIAEIDQIFKG
jgi:predicted ATPase